MRENSNKKRKGLAPCEPSRLQTTRAALSRQEWEKLLAVCMSPDFRGKNPCLAPVVALGTFAGLRTSEIVRLRWDDFDFRRRIIRVRHSKWENGVRAIPMHPFLVEVLNWMKRHLRRPKSGNLFPCAHGSDCHIRSLYRAIAAAARKAGVEKVGATTLRRTFISWWYAANTCQSVLRELAEHAQDRVIESVIQPQWPEKVAAIQRLPSPSTPMSTVHEVAKTLNFSVAGESNTEPARQEQGNQSAKENSMALYKRRTYWYYEFWFDGVRYQGSTRQTSKREAERVLAALRDDLARRRTNFRPRV